MQEPPTHGWMPRVGLGTWKRIGEHRDGTEMGRKRKTTRYCGEGVGGPRGQERGAQDPPPPWVGSQGLGWGTWKETEERSHRDGEEEEGDEGLVLQGESLGGGHGVPKLPPPPPMVWTPII